MSNLKDDEKFVRWAEDFCFTAAQDFHLLNWTVAAVRVNFFKHYQQGMTPYQVISKEICESIEDQKAKKRPKR